LGLQTSEDAKFYMAARNFEHDFDNTDQTLVIQFSVKHEQKIDCGGGYVKVYAPDTNLATLDGKSPYNIMFGPDICGSSKKMLHVILGKKGDNHLITKQINCETDVYTHAYTLILKPDNTYSVLIDNKQAQSGSLTDDWDILEPKLIKDPEQSKPEDWVDEALMDDPDHVKPDDWDNEPEFIEDPESQEPADWSEEDDGVFEPSTIRNPSYKGEWIRNQIENPDYAGHWEHPLIANPEHEDDPSLYQFNSGAIGIDLWQVKSGTIFDDILVTDDVEYAEEVAEKAIAAAEEERVLEKQELEKQELEKQELEKQKPAAADEDEEEFVDEVDDTEEYDDEEIFDEDVEDDRDEL